MGHSFQVMLWMLEIFYTDDMARPTGQAAHTAGNA
jgi:hypothetical protein